MPVSPKGSTAAEQWVKVFLRGFLLLNQGTLAETEIITTQIFLLFSYFALRYQPLYLQFSIRHAKRRVTDCILLETMLPLRGACSEPRENTIMSTCWHLTGYSHRTDTSSLPGTGAQSRHLMRSSYSRFQADKSSASPTSWMLTYALAHSANVLFQEVPVLLIKGLRNEN